MNAALIRRIIAKPGTAQHASCVAIGEAGVLIRGPSGIGKSRLATGLVHAATAAGRFARLVSDDRTIIDLSHGRLIARVHPAIAGLIEQRGLGLTPVPHESAVLLRLIVDLVADEPARLPEPEELIADLCGLTLPRLPLWHPAADPGRVLAALNLFDIAH
jgi:HPr kinase/phosphorylase